MHSDWFVTGYVHYDHARHEDVHNKQIRVHALFPGSIVPVSTSNDTPLLQMIFAGGIAAVTSRTLTAPIEKVKILAQTSPRYGGFQSICVKVIRNEGFSGLFAGNLVNCLRVFPTSAIACIIYSKMMKSTPLDLSLHQNQLMWRFMSGTTAWLVSTTLMYPMDVVRTRITIQDSVVPSPYSRYMGIGDAFRTIFREEGVYGFYKGLGPTLGTIAPFMGIQLTVYDVIKESADFQPNAFTYLVCGAFAAMVAQTVMYPLDIVRRQMQISHGPAEGRRSTISMIRQLYASGGVPCLYSGLSVAYMKVMPAASISLLVRDFLMGRLE